MKKLLLALCTLFLFTGLSEAQTLCNEVIPNVAWSCPVDGTTGVTAGKYAKWNAAGTALVIGATADGPGAYIGVAATTQVGGTAIFYTLGSISPLFDAATTANDYACISTSVAGDLTDCGASGNNHTLGRINSTIGSAGQALAWIWGHIPEAVLTPAPGTSATLSGASEFYVCTGTCTITVPLPSPGVQYCVFNDDNVSTVITLSALGGSGRYENTARTAYGTSGTGTFVSGGAAADGVCIVGRDTTHYLTVSSHGTWTAN